jgi:hypothetical protein
MKISILILISVVLINISCEDPPEDPIKDYSSIDVITGLRLTDVNGQALGLWRTPNDNPVNTFVFPNPNNGVVSVFSPDPINTIWILNVDCLNEELASDQITLAQLVYFGPEDIDKIDIQQFPGNGTNQLNLNLTDLSKGFYRVFIELDSEVIIPWHNIYIDPEISTFVDLSELDAACP